MHAPLNIFKRGLPLAALLLFFLFAFIGVLPVQSQNSGEYSFYAHLESVTVQPGQQVNQGDIIGTMGPLYSHVHLGRSTIGPAEFPPPGSGKPAYEYHAYDHGGRGWVNPSDAIGNGTWITPVEVSSTCYLTMAYNYFEGKGAYGEDYHTGDDYGCVNGSNGNGPAPVRAVAAGEVVLVENSWHDFPGIDVFIYHGESYIPPTNSSDPPNRSQSKAESKPRPKGKVPQIEVKVISNYRDYPDLVEQAKKTNSTPSMSQRLGVKTPYIVLMIVIGIAVSLIGIGRKERWAWIGMVASIILFAITFRAGIVSDALAQGIPTPIPTIVPTATPPPVKHIRQAEPVLITLPPPKIPPKDSGGSYVFTPPTGECGISTGYPEAIQQWCPYITAAAAANSIDPNWIAAQMWQESRGNQLAVSVEGATCLMQVMPMNGYLNRVDSPKSRAAYTNKYGGIFHNRPTYEQLQSDPKYCIKYGVAYLAGRLRANNGSLDAALDDYVGHDGGVYVGLVHAHYYCFVEGKTEYCGR